MNKKYIYFTFVIFQFSCNFQVIFQAKAFLTKIGWIVTSMCLYQFLKI